MLETQLLNFQLRILLMCPSNALKKKTYANNGLTK